MKASRRELAWRSFAALWLGCCSILAERAMAADGPFDLVASGLAELIGAINNQVPINELGEREEFKEQALTDRSNDEIYDSTAQQIIERSGFQQKTYKVTSKDGYITELINVINPLADQSQLKQPPVMLFHGGLIDPTAYVWASAIQHHPEKYPRTAEDGPITSSNRSLGLMLPNYGYNVWLVATRGCNKQNLGHTSLKTRLLEDLAVTPANGSLSEEFVDTLKYFEYSMDEIVEFEFPAQIDAVLNLTSSPNVTALTYSFSTQIMFSLLASEDRAHANKVHAHIAMAPILNQIGSSNLVKGLQALAINVPDALGNLFFTQVLLTRSTRLLLAALPRYTIFYDLASLVLGSNPRFQSFYEQPVMGHFLQPVSFVVEKHFSQQVRAGRLQKYDHGPAKNRQRYGSFLAPVYDLSKITVPNWMMLAGDNDLLGTMNSATQYERLIRPKPDRFVKLAKWQHLDMSISFETDTRVNAPILQFLDKFSSSD